MTDLLTDPRTELVRQSADDIHHLTCAICYKRGGPMICGLPFEQIEGIECPDGCECPECPICTAEFGAHVCAKRPWWKRWLP